MWDKQGEEQYNNFNPKNEAETIDIDEMSMSELQDALKSMKNRKAVGLDGVNLELIRYAGDFCHLKFCKVLTKVQNSKGMGNGKGDIALQEREQK